MDTKHKRKYSYNLKGDVNKVKIYYVRHGETDWNLAKKMQGGETEKPLNETGNRQANETRKKLEEIKYDILICSPMNRAKQTAEIINKDRNVPIIFDERIRERKLGKFEGYDATEELENKIWDYNLNYEIPNGENLHDFEKRILEFLEEIKQKYFDKTVLIVAHGGVAKIIKAHLYGMLESKNISEIEMKNCEIIEADI